MSTLAHQPLRAATSTTISSPFTTQPAPDRAAEPIHARQSHPHPHPPLPPPFISRAHFMEGLNLPRSWHPSQPLPEPHETVYQNRLRGIGPATTISREIEAELVNHFFDPSMDIPALATQHDLDIPTMLVWFSQPRIRAIIDAVRAFNAMREEALLSQSTHAAIKALNDAMTELANLPTARSGAATPATPAQRIRLIESSRKSASFLLRRSKEANTSATSTTPPMQYSGGNAGATPPSCHGFAGASLATRACCNQTPTRTHAPASISEISNLNSQTPTPPSSRSSESPPSTSQRSRDPCPAAP